MKRSFLGFLALAAVGSPMAQDGVTIFGGADIFIGQTKSGPRTVNRLDEGGHSATRLGFRGSEDLGDGLRANFLLEGGIGLDSGSGTILGPGFAFTRQSFVGLSGRWGSLDLGRMYTPMFYTLYRADPFGLNAVFSPLNLVSATDAQPGLGAFAAHSSNLVRYRTPAGTPFFADVAAAPGEASPASPLSGRLYGANVGYAQGPAYVSYAVQSVKSGLAAPAGATAIATYQAISGSYELGNTRLSASLIRNSSSLNNRDMASASLAQVPVTAGSGDEVRVVAVGGRHTF